jgi:hypothetical protein
VDTEKSLPGHYSYAEKDKAKRIKPPRSKGKSVLSPQVLTKKYRCRMDGITGHAQH